MTTHLHTRAFCDECGMRLAVVEVSPGFFLCEQCHSFDSVTSIASSASDVNVTAALPPGSAVTINSEIPRGSHDVARGPGPSSVTGMSDDRSNAGGEHEAVAPLSIGSRGKSAACETSLIAADLNVESFSSLETSSGIGSARETSAMLHPGVVDGSTALTLQARTAVTAGETAPNSVSDGVPSSSRETEMEPSATLAFAPSGSCSGDGLGTQQPGSHTWGDREAMPAPSGRARDRAKCPAVTGPSFEDEVAALEVEWLRCGIIMNSIALRVSAASDSISKSVSVAGA